MSHRSTTNRITVHQINGENKIPFTGGGDTGETSVDVFNTAVSCFQSMHRLPSVSKSFCYFPLTPPDKMFAPQYCKLLRIVFLLTVYITECSENASEMQST